MPQVSPVVFVVDDDVSVREALESLIRSDGWEVETFASAEAFLARAPVHGPSCLVLDVTLPDLDGPGLQQRLGSERAALPIIFITGYDDVPTTIRSGRFGTVAFLTKPFDDGALLSAIRHAIERGAS